MQNKHILFAGFIVVAIIQLFVPVNMILERELILNKGKEFRFKTAPVDPTDPFRGKYVFLSFEDYTIPVDSAKKWFWGEEVYALITVDENGLSRLSEISRTKPSSDADYLQATISAINNSENTVGISLPFDRFYMDEFKAPAAEQEYLRSSMDTASLTCGVIMVRKGKGVLKDVLINEKSIMDLNIK